MEIWEVTKLAANTERTAARSSYKASNVASEYSRILDEKISNIKADVKAMEAVREQLDEISDLQEDLTGEIKVDEDSGNANREEGTSSNLVTTEKVKRYLPDGTIMLTTYEDGRIVERVKYKPHMIVVPDYSAPPTPDGSVATKLKPTNNFYPTMLMV